MRDHAHIREGRIQGSYLRGSHSQHPLRRLIAKASLLLLAGSATVSMTGCATPAGELFPPLSQPLVFPPPPDHARVRFVGELGTEADLKPARSALAGLGEALFGADSVRSMLSPCAVFVRGDRLFACDGSAQVVHVFNLATREYQQWQPQSGDGTNGAQPATEHRRFSMPVGITGDANGRIYVSDSVAATVFLFDETGHCLGDIGYGTLKRPCGIAYDVAHDRLLIADSAHHQLLALSPDGTLLAAIGTRGGEPGQFNFPTNVAIDRTGRVFVSDTLNFRVQVLDDALKPVSQIGRLGDMPGYFSQPKGVAIDRDNHVYVVDAQFEAVQIFSPEGQLLLSFGEEGSGPGQFWLPAGIFIDLNDRIWIADSYNRRVQVFEYLPDPTSPVPPAPTPVEPAPTESAP
jgi:hypothetical protein